MTAPDRSSTTMTHLALAGGIAAMAVTRGVHTDILGALPDATLALFALGGASLAAPAFAVLCAAAFAIDLLAVTFGGVDASCFSWAYPFLVPAYACLWAAGRYARRAGTFAGTALRLMSTVPAAVLLSYAISSGSFQWLAVHTPTTLGGWVERVAPYAVHAVGWTACYTVLGLALVAAGRGLRGAFTARA